MVLLERMRWAVAPVQQRGIALLWGGLAAFLAAGGLATLFELAAALRIALYLAMVAGWFAAACGMIGYFRWFFGQAKAEAQRLNALRPKDERQDT